MAGWLLGFVCCLIFVYLVDKLVGIVCFGSLLCFLFCWLVIVDCLVGSRVGYMVAIIHINIKS